MINANNKIAEQLSKVLYKFGSGIGDIDPLLGQSSDYYYNHITAVTILFGINEYYSPKQLVIFASGSISVCEQPLVVPNRPRKDSMSIAIHMCSETDKDRTIYMYFHKGNTYTEVVMGVPEYAKLWGPAVDENGNVV